MTYFKGVLIGFATVLVGTPFALIAWAIWRSRGGGGTVSFSPMGLTNHLAHSPGFWILIIVLFAAGFVSSVGLQKR